MRQGILPIIEWPTVEVAHASTSRDSQVDPTKHDPDAVIRKFKAFLKPNRARLMRETRVMSHDRSRIIFMIVVALHEVGATPDEIGAVVWRSPYFISKHGTDRTKLSQEIIRILAKVRLPK